VLAAALFPRWLPVVGPDAHGLALVGLSVVALMLALSAARAQVGIAAKTISISLAAVASVTGALLSLGAFAIAG
jgi:hypothetical protein